jgi:PadR family transcriptional regulator PadR
VQIEPYTIALPSHAPIPEPLRPSSELLAAWLLVLVEGGVTHGYDMRRELAARRLAVDYPSVYRMLNKLQRDGQLRSRWGKTVAGPRRRLYEITPAGLRSLAKIVDRLSAVSQTHDTFFEAYAQTVGHFARSASGLSEPATAESPQRGVNLLALDHLALSVQDPDAMQAFLCGHVGMQELERSADTVLVGGDVRATKLSLIPVKGSREPAALRRIVLKIADLPQAVSALPAGTKIQQDGPRSIWFEGPEGLGLGFTPMVAGEIDYDIAHVLLRVADPDETATAMVALGCARRGGTLHVGDKRITLEELPAWSDRPLLDHIGVHAGSIQAVAEQARQRGYEINEGSADSTIAIVLPGPERIMFEFFEDHA